jgi:hypothetical protein
MLVAFLGVWLIAFGAASAFNCDAKGYTPEQCGESIRNERLVTDPR